MHSKHYTHFLESKAQHLRCACVRPTLFGLVQDCILYALVKGHLLIQVLLPDGLCKHALVQVIVAVKQPAVSDASSTG